LSGLLVSWLDDASGALVGWGGVGWGGVGLKLGLGMRGQEKEKRQVAMLLGSVGWAAHNLFRCQMFGRPVGRCGDACLLF
jgi:hypothetical protein